MLLVVDVGNTDIVFGFYEDQTWKAVLRTPTHQPWSANGVVNWIKKEWASKDLGDTLPSLALISSVVPSISPRVFGLMQVLRLAIGSGLAGRRGREGLAEAQKEHQKQVGRLSCGCRLPWLPTVASPFF